MLLTSWGDELDVVCEEQMIACQFICLVIDKYQEEKGSKNRALGPVVCNIALATFLIDWTNN